MMTVQDILHFADATGCTEADAEQAGFDASFNQPNVHNCRFTLFRSRELTQAWERGHKRGTEAKLRQMG